MPRIIDRQKICEERFKDNWGMRLELYHWLKRTHPRYFYRLHPARDILSVRKKCFFGLRRVEYGSGAKMITVDMNLDVWVNNREVMWLAEEILEKICELTQEGRNQVDS